MFPAESIKQLVLQYVVPTVAGMLSTWLTSSQVLAVFHITQSAAVGGITKALVFIVTFGFTWLSGHHILTGKWSGGAAAAKK